MRYFVEIFNLQIQVMVVVIVVLVGIPYIILHNSLTADEQEDKYEEAHRYLGEREQEKDLRISSQIYWPRICCCGISKHLPLHQELSTPVREHVFFQSAFTPTSGCTVLVKWLIY